MGRREGYVRPAHLLPCQVEGCLKRQKARGLCPKHYRMLLTYGDPLTPPRQGLSGSENPAWRPVVGYQQAHDRLGPVTGPCAAGCGRPAQEWAYDEGDAQQLVSPLGRRYSLDPSHYLAMCRSCHRKSDGRIANLRRT